MKNKTFTANMPSRTPLQDSRPMQTSCHSPILSTPRKLVTAESVRVGHPDKFCDQIADAILDAHLEQDSNARVAVEVFATRGKILIGGEVSSKADVNYRQIVADVINRIGYKEADLQEEIVLPKEVYEREAREKGASMSGQPAGAPYKKRYAPLAVEVRIH